MKRLLLFLTTVVFCLRGISQEPVSFNYQAIVHNAKGEVVASHIVSFKLSILEGNAYDTVVYSERHIVTTNQFGSVTMSIGNGTDKTGNFTSVNWNADKHFLRVEIDTSGGTDYIDQGTTQILSVPYTLSPKISRNASSIIIENKLFISRKYVGVFLDYRQTGPGSYNGPNLIWIKTSLSDTYGKISAYGKKCHFSPGDKLYLKRTYYSPGDVSGFWEYWIENDSSIYYRVTEFQHDRKIFVENWFN
jgi:hypothetical protein